MRRFNVSPNDIEDSEATLRGSEAHHLRDVLRLKPGARITLFDGTGATYEGKIDRLSGDTVTVRIEKKNEADDNRPRLHLGQALITGKKIDLVVQKATELGIASITPFTSAYCSAKEPSANKRERWLRIAMESCKQCNRAVPPKIEPPINIKDCFEKAAGCDLKIVFWEEKADLNLKDIEKRIDREQPRSAFYLIGPEGGLTDDEVAAAKEYGFLSVTLGRQIMRAETASIAAGAVLQYLLGNLD
ncbi:MAG: 16S rRNA (uracil(1498)-N(3))-methyltransferase [Desulfurivibrionaceae bacterium]|nr:16S rRNA (uracil(1498)-N(3))-methyltransferase [Desulfobulbales bacterium]MDT8335396.1 16S rRNA (uracil(1498)-N(3))-methyltransferase [Desulfurivibrionaceae bacterium]